MPSTADGQPYVFISYASADQERVTPIIEWLERAGASVWIDREGIRGGENYGAEIVDAIRHASAIVLFASNAALSSRNVLQEVALAWRFERPYVPLMLGDVSIPDQMAYWLETAQWITLSEHPQSGELNKVVEALRRHGIEIQRGPFGGNTRRRRDPPYLVGRERELRLLADKAETARSGRGGIVLVGGEAGIGKTTLVDVAISKAEGEGFTILEGHCFDLVETPAYGPWVDLFLHVPPLGDVAPPDAFAVPGAVGRVQSQLALFAQVERFLAIVSMRQPVIVVLEDLHWADPASLDLVRYLARSVASLPVVIVVTYRSDELSRVPPLVALQSHLVTDRNVERIELLPLSTDEVSQLVTQRYSLPDVENERLTAYLLARTEGNSLFVSELLRTLEESREISRHGHDWSVEQLNERGLPPLLREVIDGRIQRFDQAGQRLLGVAAIIGQTVSLKMWKHVSNADEEVLMNLAEQAEAAHVLVGDPGGRAVSFAHALIREALYENVPAVRRRQLHQRTGEVLERIAVENRDSYSGQLGYHFQRAGIAERAIPYLIRAGILAQESHSHETAIAYFRRALALCDESSPHRLTDEFRDFGAQASEGLGSSLIWTGDPTLARQVLHQGLSRANSALRRSRLLLLIGRAWFADGNEIEGHRFYDVAEAELGTEPESEPEAWWHARIDIALQRIASLYFGSLTYARGEELLDNVERYRDLIESHGSQQQRVTFLHRNHLARIRQERYVVSRDMVENIRLAASIAGQLDDTGLRCELTFSVGFAELWYGELESAQRHLIESLELADRIGNLFEQVLIHTYLAVIARKRGEVDLAEEQTLRCLDVLQKTDGPPQYVAAAKATLCWVAWCRGQRQEAWLFGREALCEWEQRSYPFKWLGIWPMVALSIEQDDMLEASRLAAELQNPELQAVPAGLHHLIEETGAAMRLGDEKAAANVLAEALAQARLAGFL